MVAIQRSFGRSYLMKGTNMEEEEKIEEEISSKVGIDFDAHNREARKQNAIANQFFLNKEVELAGSDISRKKKIINIIRMPEGQLKNQAILAIKRGF